MSWSMSKEKIDMRLGAVGNGERVAVISAISLFAFMFFHWFGVKAVNTSNLLFAIRAVGSGKNAWEALDYTPMVLVITIVAALAVPALRAAGGLGRSSMPVNVVVAVLGFASVGLIVFRIVDPPIFDVERTIKVEGAVQTPIFLALAAAAGIVFGGLMAVREETGQRGAGDPATTSQRRA